MNVSVKKTIVLLFVLIALSNPVNVFSDRDVVHDQFLINFKESVIENNLTDLKKLLSPDYVIQDEQSLITNVKEVVEFDYVSRPVITEIDSDLSTITIRASLRWEYVFAGSGSGSFELSPVTFEFFVVNMDSQSLITDSNFEEQLDRNHHTENIQAYTEKIFSTALLYGGVLVASMITTGLILYLWMRYSLKHFTKKQLNN